MAWIVRSLHPILHRNIIFQRGQNMMGPARPASAAPTEPAWGAVFSLTLGVFGLVTAEFLPASLLTPMAADLHVTEAMAGQAVTATAMVALVASLLISAATRRIDRRHV